MAGETLKKRNIVLTGFMGTGKSAVGRYLARCLQMDFVDTDEEIERRTGLKIPEIFAKYGENYFRAEESKVVEEVAGRENCVIATGGGVVLNPENIRKLRERGVIILLEASPEVIAERVLASEERPLLSCSRDPVGRIKELLKFRAPFYQNCDLRIDTSCLGLEKVVEKIVSLLEEQGWEVEKVKDRGKLEG